MRAYVIAYRRYSDLTNEWVSKLSQTGYSTLEAAQRYVESRPGVTVGITPMYYQTAHYEEYYIHDILIQEEGQT